MYFNCDPKLHSINLLFSDHIKETGGSCQFFYGGFCFVFIYCFELFI